MDSKHPTSLLGPQCTWNILVWVEGSWVDMCSLPLVDLLGQCSGGSFSRAPEDTPLQWGGGPSSLLFFLWFLILTETWFDICMNAFTCFFD